MYRASRAVALAKKTGAPLPQVPQLKDFYETGAEFYKGSVVMIAGMPAAFKSMFTLDIVRSMEVSCLYVSADSDAATQISRLAAQLTGWRHQDIRVQMDEDPEKADYYADVLRQSKVQFSFDSNPDVWDIENEINAWVELYDEYPEVIVVDNLRNVFSGADNEHTGYKTIQQKLIDISRETGSCIITMHHMSEAGGRKSTDPAPRSAIDGKVSQLPDMILSVAREDDQFRMVAVKNRHNPDHPEAEREHWLTLRVDGATASFHHQTSMQERVQAIEAAWTPTSVLDKHPAGV